MKDFDTIQVITGKKWVNKKLFIFFTKVIFFLQCIYLYGNFDLVLIYNEGQIRFMQEKLILTYIVIQMNLCIHYYLVYLIIPTLISIPKNSCELMKLMVYYERCSPFYWRAVVYFIRIFWIG